MSKSPNLRHYIPFIIGLIVVCCFVGAVDNGFVNFDDPLYVTENPHVADGLNVQGVIWAWTSIGFAANWHPLTLMSHMMDVSLFGFDPTGHHLVSVLLHAFNSVLLFWVFVKLTGNFWPSCFLALIWAIHPLRVESVAWISERKDLLFFLFWMLGLLAYARYATKKKWTAYLAVTACFAAALASKPMAITFPATLLLLDYWPLKRFDLESGITAQTKRLFQLIVEKLPLLLMSIGAAALTIVSQNSGNAIVDVASRGSIPRLTTAINGIVAYIWQTLWPMNLAVYYPHSIINALSAQQTGMIVTKFTGIAIFSFLAWRWRSKHPYILVGWLWFLGDQEHADRYTYIAQVGLLAALIWWVSEKLATVTARGRAVWASIAMVVLLLLGSVSRTQIAYWKNSVTLWSRAYSVTPRNYKTLHNLGSSLFDAHEYEKALSVYKVFVEEFPNQVMAHMGYGASLWKIGLITEGKTVLEKGLSMDPHYHRLLNIYGKMLFALKEFTRASEMFSRAAASKPEMRIYSFNLATAQFEAGDQHLSSQTIATISSFAGRQSLIAAKEAWANILSPLPDNVDALFHAKQAMLLRPVEDYKYYEILAIAYAANGRFEEAVQTEEKALALITKSENNTAIISVIKKRIESFRNKIPYTAPAN